MVLYCAIHAWYITRLSQVSVGSLVVRNWPARPLRSPGCGLRGGHSGLLPTEVPRHRGRRVQSRLSVAEIGLLLQEIARVCRRHDNTITYGCRCVRTRRNAAGGVCGSNGTHHDGASAHPDSIRRGDKEENLRCRSQGEVSTCSASQSNLFGGLRLPSLPGDGIKGGSHPAPRLLKGSSRAATDGSSAPTTRFRMVSARERRPM